MKPVTHEKKFGAAIRLTIRLNKLQVCVLPAAPAIKPRAPAATKYERDVH